MPAKRLRYDVHPGVAMVRKWVETLEERTGRSLPTWLKLVRARGPKGEAARREWLEREHGLGTNSAGWIAERASGRGRVDEDPAEYLKAAERYVAAMFGGPKAGLLPLYERLYALARSLGRDVRLCPAKTIVPVYRKHVIAQIKPTTRTRIDFGLALGDAKVPKRLLPTGGLEKGDRITHRFALAAPADLDDEVRRWLKAAYDRDA